ncbi:acylneuraminate cytidylyltransferase family protein [uncultured Rikenella sp.]|uniref:acylneuraminate cytidylyltransferase family protein n=1 Tax=uncultured Rikenella sp. TaxID=368003 RepID=UPI00262F3ADA|nr:acylneuraminate cytidylyltransferase family protein [uncultured Rikenella sp.]
MKVLAIIPARGGSKGLPGKNIRPLLGKPLIGWTIEQAKASKYITEIFVSTDSQEIADVAERFGVSVPELRPAELASDTAPSSGFVVYTIEKLRREGKEFDYIILLEPTSPLRTSRDIDSAVELALSHPDKVGVVSLGKVHMEHPQIVKRINDNGEVIPYVSQEHKLTQRQQADAAYFPYGVIYMVKTEHFLQTHEFYGSRSLPYFIERWQCYEIDDIYDFVAIEAILKLTQK